MDRFQKSIPAFIFSLISIYAVAQDKPPEKTERQKRDSTNIVESRQDLEDEFQELAKQKIYVDQHPLDAAIGSFEIKNENGNYTLRFGGYAKLTMFYDAGLESELFFNIYNIKTTEEKPVGRFNIHAYESRLSTEVLGNSSIGTYRLFIEGDFLGSPRGDFRMRHAYGQFKGFIVGQTWSYFMDVNATAFSIDFNGSNAVPFNRKPLIGYMNRNSIENLSFGFSIENPSGNLFSNQNNARPQLYPDFVAKVIKTLKNGHIQFAAVHRSFIYNDTISGDETTTEGFGILGSGKIELNKTFEFIFQASYGKGITEYISLNKDLITKGDGTFGAPRSFSAFAGLVYHIDYRSFVNVNGSFVNLIDVFSLPETDFKYGYQFNANYIFEVSQNLSTGVEFVHGYNQNIAGDSGWASRFYGYVMFSF